MLKKTIILIIFCGALFQCGWALTINGNYTLGGEYKQDITIQGDNITITLTAGVDIHGKLSVIGSGSGVKIVSSGSSKWPIRVRDDIHLKNATLDISYLRSGYGILSGAGGNKIYIEKTKITASGTALEATNSIIRARFSSFIATGTLTPVDLRYNGNDSALLKNPILEFCYFQKSDSSVYSLDTTFVNVTPAAWTFDLEGSCFSPARKIPSNGASYDYSPESTAYNSALPPDPVNGILKVTFSSTSTHFDKIIPPNTTLVVGGTLPPGRKLKLGFNEDSGVYEGGAVLILDTYLTVIGSDSAASSVGDEFHSEGTAAKPNEIRGKSSFNLHGKQHNIKYTNFSDFSASGSFALRNYASDVVIQNNNFNNNIYEAVRNYGARAIVQNNTFSAGISNYALRSYDTATGSNYSNNTFNTAAGGLEISTNGTVTIQNNTFSSSTRSSAPLRIRAGGATVAGNSFYAADGASGVRVDSGNPSFSNNTINYTSGKGVQVDNGSPSFTGNTITGSNTSGAAAIHIKGGLPAFRQNNISGYANGQALYLTDISVSVSITFSQNNFKDANPLVYSSGNGPYILENNYWGAATPASANFTSYGAADYEPWLNAAYPNGTATYKKAEPIITISPMNTQSLGSAPADILFKIDDLGYHKGTPLEYQFRIADSAAGLSAAAVSTNAGFPAGANIYHAVPGLLRGKTYYWQARVRNTTDNQGYSDWPVYEFTINPVRLNLTLSAWNTLLGNTPLTQQSAGAAVYYRQAFSNSDTAVIGPATITAILPDDVYWNGELRVTGLGASNGSITIRAYENTAASGTPKTYTAALSGDTNLTYANLGIPQSDVYKYRRLELMITTLPAGAAGTFVYGSIVK
ncbi:hypothetical protein NO1_0877 [Candidatus Termititenax aidoneus]|uniref:Right handed beta helix domain-containing protein n=1 Tax=Termititenax aidoneus TaxID=2218524 RepID=A0A388TA10_TERA1|nr:hypothetical protein NO1_0877 [Candidatus Termititenax aidoneus]